MTIAISLVSMALAVKDWASAHGRLPALTECTIHNGFPHHYTTIWRHFGASPDFSALLTVAEAATAAQHTIVYRLCLRCDASFPDEGAHIRLCTTCRRRIFLSP